MNNKIKELNNKLRQTVILYNKACEYRNESTISDYDELIQGLIEDCEQLGIRVIYQTDEQDDITITEMLFDVEGKNEEHIIFNAGQRMKKLTDIAEKYISAVKKRGDLRPHCNDDDDFMEISIWELQEALTAAYEAGENNGQED